LEAGLIESCSCGEILGYELQFGRLHHRKRFLSHLLKRHASSYVIIRKELEHLPGLLQVGIRGDLNVVYTSSFAAALASSLCFLTW
jgi:hypothetical protein